MMGEHADDVLDGSVCQFCGQWFDDVLAGEESPGYPRSCPACKTPDGDDE